MSLTETQKIPSVTNITLVTFQRKKECPECPQCNLAFAKESDLKLHMEESRWKKYVEEKHGSNFRCEDCCLFFGTKQGLMQHLGKMHECREKLFDCPECDKTFKNKHGVKFHRKQVHQKVTRVNCPECEKEIYNKYGLVQHLLKCRGREDKD